MPLNPQSKDVYRPGVGVVLCKGGRVFVGERLDTPGAWQLPQGGIDPGETPHQALIREVSEETGLIITSHDILAEVREWLAYDLPANVIPLLFGGRYRGQRQKWFAVAYGGPDAAINLRTSDAPEFSRWQWLEPDRVVDVAVSFKRALYEQVMAELMVAILDAR
ncbi:MAG: RNA pyrophosphohydrolase [Pseudomonadota bacterium]